MSSGNISAFAIRHPVPPVVLFIVLMVAGFACYLTLDVAGDPDIDFPVVTVSVSRPGAAPAELETQVTKKIEAAVGAIEGLDHISSTIVDGVSNTTLEFKVGYNTDRAVNDVRDAVGRIRSDLPQDIYEPQVTRQNVSGDEKLIYNITSPNRSISELSWLVDNDISRVLTRIPGVGAVERFGGQDREIRINLSPTRLMALGVTADEVNAQLRNLNVDLPGGRGNVSLAEQSIRTLGSAHTVEQLGETEITVPNGTRVRLKNLAEIVDGAAELRMISRLDGKPSLGFAITRAPNSSEVTMAAEVAKALVILSKDYPDVQITLVLDFVKFTKESFYASIEALLLGTILAVGVVWWFLRDGRATAISSMAMPLSTIPTFLAMKWLGFTLNGVTMLALALVVGILVDDAIVEIENIVRHIRMGKRPFQAALEAADEIGLAVIATTMTIVAVFVPVSFMPGIPGQYFRSFGITVAVAVLFSLLVARLITPMMAAYFLRPAQRHHGSQVWMGPYLRLLSWCLAHRRWTVAVGVAFFLVSIGMAAMLPSGFTPNQDPGFSIIELQLPPGATLYDTDAVNQQVTALFLKRPEVQSVWARAGRGNRVQMGRIFVLLTDRAKRMNRKSFEAVMEPELKKIPGIRIGFNAIEGFSNRDVSILLTSNDGDLLEKTADELRRQMLTLPFLANVTSTAPLQRPEIEIRPRRDVAAEQGVSVASIAQVVKIATLGDIDTNTAKFDLADRQVPIRVQIDPKWREDLGVLSNLRVRTGSGQLLPLSAVADLGLGSSDSEINRFDRARKVAVEADLHGKDLGDATKEIDRLPVLADLPAGVSRPSYGTTEQMRIMFVGFAVALVTGIGLNFAVLALLFRNFFQPLTILAALPLSLGGAIAGLMAFNLSLSLPALIGIIMLMGIVTKNSILLVEYAMMSRRDLGMDRRSALIDAGAKRARPILMTTIAMTAGMMPIALGLGNDAEFRQPMAVAVIGGLVSSTLLSLVFIPVVFSIVDDIERWLAPKVAVLVTPREESDAGSVSGTPPVT
jgi:hydrophobe/amphiphile efflux-1 (HAE1) family protein